jgi:hypothetical protein
MREMRVTLLRGWKKSIVLLEGSQASPVCPSNKCESEDILELLEAVTETGAAKIWLSK